MDKSDKIKKHANTEAQKKDEAQKPEDLEIVHLKEKIEELENQVKRIFADYQNLERRTKDERSIWIRNATKDLITRLLSVLDDLYRANKHLKNEGLRLIIQKFFGILNKEGLTEIPPTNGSLFIPESMRSIATVETDKEKDGRVVEEILTGYKLNGEVIRPAEVIVGKKGDSETSSE